MAVLPSQSVFVKGERRDVSINVTSTTNANLSGTTATMAVYDKSSNVVLASGAASVAGTTTLTITRVWDTANVSVGLYRAVFTVLISTSVYKWQLGIRVDPLPSP